MSLSPASSRTQWLGIEAAIQHCTAGIGIWEWASNDEGSEPDVVMACAGDVPTLETLAAVDFLGSNSPTKDSGRQCRRPDDPAAGNRASAWPAGHDFDSLFTTDKPIIFAYHGYPWLIHRLTYRRNNHDNFHVRGYKEEGTTTTPFDMAVLNDLDRFHLAMDVVDRVARTGAIGGHFKQFVRNKLIEHKQYVHEHGIDMPEILNWKWEH